jgi:hypothetical protein
MMYFLSRTVLYFDLLETLSLTDMMLELSLITLVMTWQNKIEDPSRYKFAYSNIPTLNLSVND